MSTLLEQAIVDAEALKEAAMKNAEASIIEKYSSEVKAAVASLIEQEGEDLLLGLVLGGELGSSDLLHLVGLDLVLYHWWTSNW